MESILKNEKATLLTLIDTDETMMNHDVSWISSAFIYV
jgi:hypothetical protein